METLQILQEKLWGKCNPNSYTILWTNETLPTSTTWSTGYSDYEIIPFDWGFQLIRTNGRIAPPTTVNFGKYISEENYLGAFERAIDFLKLNSERSIALPSGLFND